MDTTSRLIMLLEVVEQGSFSKAAEMRNIDRSVISKQISKLEDELGVRLLNRTTRSFSLTAAGAEMVKKAKELRLLLNDTVQLAENYHQEPRGLLRITTSTILGRRYIQPVINDFQKRFPQVSIDMRLDDRLVDMVSEGFDLAFRVGEPRDSSLIARKLARNRVLLLATPQFVNAYGEPQSMEELGKLPAATYHSAHKRVDTISYINDQGEQCEQGINAVYSANDGEVLLDKVLSHTAYVLAPAFLINDEIKSGKLVPLLPHITLPDYSAMYALYPHRDLPVRTRLFLDAVRHYIGEGVPRWERNIPGLDNLYQGR
ncbi:MULTISPECIES: LysR family transcriptional regulator [Pseudoalteromonas]|uniref:LysR family transcriptional regulator n=1 Tax=Pseudoalteromonas TaxID=53246 RepID=UPI00034A2D68|nr:MULTISPECIES: LysR family transcriptional regulator [Pseudoalteromonas]MCF2860998.1 LysR family transcriptional regulator [Pseudoalteromonas sp. CNAT2-18]MCG7556867.1 LysR family transcriptional regulator [Pseudoalteromonas sp. CNAT2-18.1]MCG7566001.1 LysR family transcriptional regulator [Pseudoalteromonas sp. CnMc7-15]MCG7569587.1 LysR family transcriptional regulator [Pseudoalteromonas sp. CNC9-20]RZF83001.1 LysR family transcriptional regulator [Pseudoalteromonas sp. CO325X]|tara:strand:- start:231 stop:1178 length:948 start_codon:yes stop_codon:yes gene_type:complete